MFCLLSSALDKGSFSLVLSAEINDLPFMYFILISFKATQGLFRIFFAVYNLGNFKIILINFKFGIVPKYEFESPLSALDELFYLGC